MAIISPITSISRVEELVSQYSAREKKPVEALEIKKTALSKKTAVLTDLKTRLKALKTRLKGFTDVGTEAKLGAKSAVSSNESVFTVTADATAARGVNTISVSRIARNDIAVSDIFSKKASTLASQLKGIQQFSIQAGSNPVQTISVSAKKASETNKEYLNRIAQFVNILVSGVTAKVVANTAKQVRLTFVADEPGSGNAIVLGGVGDSTILKELGFTDDDSDRKQFTQAAGGFFIQEPEGLNALVTVNGIEISSSSNALTDVVQGVTINIRKAQESGSAPETFTVSQDTGEIRKQIDAFIEEYNKVITYITSKTSVDVTSNTRGELAGDFTYMNLRLRLRGIVSQPLEGVQQGSPSLLTDIGIKINSNGTLAVDNEDTLTTAIQNNSEAVTNLFASTNGLASRLTSLLDTFVNAGTAIDRNISTIRQRTETMNRQISRYESRFRQTETTLRQKFTGLERALALLNAQQVLLQQYSLASINLFQFQNIGLTRYSQRRF